MLIVGINSVAMQNGMLGVKICQSSVMWAAVVGNLLVM